DNTAINERDRGETKTSGDQSNSPADLKTTQAIRQALMKDGELSTTAKNIKVITANGHVTLRGPVKTAQEKAKIGQLAKSAAGGVVGGLIGVGIPETEAKRDDEKLEKGNYLLAVHTDGSKDVDRAKDIFKPAGAEDVSTVSEASAPKA